MAPGTEDPTRLGCHLREAASTSPALANTKDGIFDAILQGGFEASDRPSRRLHASPASAAPGCAVPASGPPDCLRKLRQTGSVASFELRPLRYRPRSATAPFAPVNGAKGLRLRSGLRRAGIGHRRMLRNRLGGFGRVGFPSLPLARGHWQARLSPSLPRPRTALCSPAPNCLRLR